MVSHSAFPVSNSLVVNGKRETSSIDTGVAFGVARAQANSYALIWLAFNTSGLFTALIKFMKYCEMKGPVCKQ